MENSSALAFSVSRQSPPKEKSTTNLLSQLTPSSTRLAKQFPIPVPWLSLHLQAPPQPQLQSHTRQQIQRLNASNYLIVLITRLHTKDNNQAGTIWLLEPTGSQSSFLHSLIYTRTGRRALPRAKRASSQFRGFRSTRHGSAGVDCGGERRGHPRTQGVPAALHA